jgi:hypothetical protein
MGITIDEKVGEIKTLASNLARVIIKTQKKVEVINEKIKKFKLPIKIKLKNQSLEFCDERFIPYEIKIQKFKKSKRQVKNIATKYGLGFSEYSGDEYWLTDNSNEIKAEVKLQELVISTNYSKAEKLVEELLPLYLRR